MPPDGSESDRVAIAEDGDDLAKELVFAERRVVPQMRVAAGEDAIALSADQSVRNESLVAIADDNTAGEQFGGASPANGQHVSGPDGGQHAGPIDLQPHLSKLANHLRGQIMFGLVEKFSVGLRWMLSHHQRTTCSRACRAVAIPFSRATKRSGCCGTAPAWIAPCRIAARWFQRRSRSERPVSGMAVSSLASESLFAVPLCSSSFCPPSSTTGMRPVPYCTDCTPVRFPVPVAAQRFAVVPPRPMK